MLETLCTLCAIKSSSEYLNLFENFCDEYRIDTLIKKYLNIEIQSSFLCIECFDQLKSFHKYYEKIQNAQKIILDLTSNVKYENTNKQQLTNERCNSQFPKEESHESIDVIIEHLIQSEQSDDDHSVDMKVDNFYHEINDSKNNQSEQVGKDTGECFPVIESSTSRNISDKVEGKIPSQIKRYNKKSKGVNDENNKQENRISFMTQEDFQNVDYDSVKNHDKKIANFMDLTCTVCNEKFPSFNQIMRHYHNTHKIRGFINCCELKFYTRLELVDHIDCSHLNSDRLTCHLCGKKLGNTRSLRRHMISLHHWKKDELYPCDICPNISFSKRVELKKHKFEVHTTNRYVCLKCKRSFKGERNLRVHEENIHNRKPPSSFVCDLCGKIFKTAGGFYKHTKEIHEGKVKGRRECDKCGSIVKNLEFHKKMAHPPEGTIIKCSDCNKQLKTWFALKSHRANIHRVDKRKFLCNICDKGFKNQKLLLEHTASHTGQPLYTCTYCPTTFKHESNYLKHKKRQHTTEWAEEKRLKYLSLKNSKEDKNE